jgi:threonine dehydratase
MISIADIRNAAGRIRPYVRTTPLIRLEALDEHLGCRVYAKLENLQVTGSFKFRGAMNAALQLTEGQLAHGLVAASSGNHGKALSHAAKLLGTTATIVIPDTAPSVKVDAIEALGATVVRSSVEERFQVAESLASEMGASLIPPYDDPRIMAGQGTVGLEIAQQLPDASVVVAPVSGGGLLGGLSLAMKKTLPNVRVYGAEPAARPRWTKSLEAGVPVTVRSNPTLADALVTLTPGKACFPVVRAHADGVVAVGENALLSASNLLLTEGKILAEYSSAIGIAAVREGLIGVSPEDRVCFVISGGSIGFDQIDRLAGW